MEKRFRKEHQNRPRSLQIQYDTSAYKHLSEMFGSKLKGMRDIWTREITYIPCTGKIGYQTQTFCSQEPESWPRGKGLPLLVQEQHLLLLFG